MIDTPNARSAYILVNFNDVCGVTYDALKTDLLCVGLAWMQTSKMFQFLCGNFEFFVKKMMLLKFLENNLKCCVKTINVLNT